MQQLLKEQQQNNEIITLHSMHCHFVLTSFLHYEQFEEPDGFLELPGSGV
jgi:hypothetical protein